MARLGITPELVLDLAARHTDDHAVLEALRAHGIPPAAQAWFDGQFVEDELQASHSHPVEEVTIVQAGAATANGRLRAIAVHGATEIVTYPT